MKKENQTVTKPILKYLKNLTRAGYPVWYYKVHGGAYQKAGIPDVHVTWNGLSVWIEAKVDGTDVTPLQQDTINDIRKANGVVLVARSVEEVREFFEEFLIPKKTRRST